MPSDVASSDCLSGTSSFILSTVGGKVFGGFGEGVALSSWSETLSGMLFRQHIQENKDATASK